MAKQTVRTINFEEGKTTFGVNGYGYGYGDGK